MKEITKNESYENSGLDIRTVKIEEIDQEGSSLDVLRFFVIGKGGKILTAGIKKKDILYHAGMNVPVSELTELALADKKQKKRFYYKKYKIMMQDINENKISKIGKRRINAVKMWLEQDIPYKDIANELNVDECTIFRDIKYFKKIETGKIREFLTAKTLPGKKPIENYVKIKVKQIRKDYKYSYRKISKLLKEEGIIISYTAVSNILNDKYIKSV